MDEWSRMIPKLMYINLMGYDVSFSKSSAISLLASKKLNHNILGYLLLIIASDYSDETLFLITQSVINHLYSTDVRRVFLALTCLNNIASVEMLHSLTAEICKQLEKTHPAYTAKALLILCLRHFNLCGHNEEITELVIPYLKRYPLVVFQYLNALAENKISIEEIVNENVDDLILFAKGEDSFLGCFAIKLLGYVSSPVLTEKLATLINYTTKLIPSTPGGNARHAARLHEICKLLLVQEDERCRNFALTSLSSLLNDGMPISLRYVALRTMWSVLSFNPFIAARISRFVDMISDCVTASDSLFFLSLHLLRLVMNKHILDKLIVMLDSTNASWKRSALADVSLEVLTTRFAEEEWAPDLANKLLVRHGDVIASTAYSTFLTGVQRMPVELQTKLVEICHETLSNEVPMYSKALQSYIWIIGEYCDLLDLRDVNSVKFLSHLHKVVDQNNTALFISAIAKLAARVEIWRIPIMKIISSYTTSRDSETQTRALEVLEILKIPEYAAIVLDAVGMMEEKEVEEVQEIHIDTKKKGESLEEDLLDLLAGPSDTTEQKSKGDSLLDLISVEPVQSSNSFIDQFAQKPQPKKIKPFIEEQVINETTRLRCVVKMLSVGNFEAMFILASTIPLNCDMEFSCVSGWKQKVFSAQIEANQVLQKVTMTDPNESTEFVARVRVKGAVGGRPVEKIVVFQIKCV
eukprot:TRINITY_DN2990_c0_g1_i1.p1 TRINITY_DN2990_c0_g1~~TRINITY_DN2990_c0_g1_i1.p1  ORF type:complete len:741 (-),score=207.87 TRINITY_DN2990_c0_g1_i1:4-2088(-)